MAIFMKYGDLKGEVTADGYKDWVEFSSFQWGLGRGISSGVGGGSKREATAPSVSEITLTKTMDAFSPLSLKEAIGGKAVVSKGRADADGQRWEACRLSKFILTDTLISGYSMSSGGDRPSESLSLNFNKFDSEYIKIDDKFQPTTTGHVIYNIAEAKSS